MLQNESYTTRWEDDYLVYKDFLIMSSAYWPAAILTLYLAVVFIIGPKIMQERKPLDLKIPMSVYNVLQIFLNTKLFLLAYRYIRKYCIFCPLLSQPIQEAKEPIFYNFEIYHFYLLMKFLDLTDTLFIVFRKKRQQITLLHMHHHLTMCAGTWYALYAQPRVYCAYLVMINSLVHVIMYIYYLMTSWISGLSNVVWIKRSITQTQIGQHVSIVVFYTSLFVNGYFFGATLAFVMFITNLIVMIRFFVKYYIKAYVKTKKIF